METDRSNRKLIGQNFLSFVKTKFIWKVLKTTIAIGFKFETLQTCIKKPNQTNHKSNFLMFTRNLILETDQSKRKPIGQNFLSFVKIEFEFCLDNKQQLAINLKILQTCIEKQNQTNHNSNFLLFTRNLVFLKLTSQKANLSVRTS